MERHNSTNLTPCSIWVVNKLGDIHGYSWRNVSLFCGFCMIAGLTVILNFLVVKVLSARKRTSGENLFFLLSISDFFVGMVTLPLFSLRFLNLSSELKCKLYPWMNFFTVFPFGFSWCLTTLITIVRYVVLLHKDCRSVFLGNKWNNVFCVIACLANILLGSISALLEERKIRDERAELSSNLPNISLTQVVIVCFEALLIFCNSVLTMRLYRFVQRQTKSIEAHRHTKEDTSKKMTKTVINIFICLTLCQTPHALTVTSLWFKLVENSETVFFLVNITTLFLFSNSCWNAVIILRSSKVQNMRSSTQSRCTLKSFVL